MPSMDKQEQLRAALEIRQQGNAHQAQAILANTLEHFPGDVDLSRQFALGAEAIGERATALACLRRAIDAQSHHSHQLSLDLASLLAADAQEGAGIKVLEQSLFISPEHPVSWLLLGQLRAATGSHAGALRANYEAVTRAQCSGQWLSEATTPEPLMDAVLHAFESVRAGKREILFASYAHLREQSPSGSLDRVDYALAAYLKEVQAKPASEHQKPRFFYFPGLPDQTLHSPYLHTWAHQLEAGFRDIKDEALQVFTQDGSFQNFLELSEKARMEDYINGDGETPSWEAFFFYRRGKRFDGNHQRCPKTSAILNSIDLCKIEHQAPEICFSVLKPGTHILPHYGVSNIRCVMHLPLVVPSNCALRFGTGQEYLWQEGQTVLFDDTFQHEAWNRSKETRIVLLMDCWNPHLTLIERLAVKSLIETITGFQLADRAARLHSAAP